MTSTGYLHILIAVIMLSISLFFFFKPPLEINPYFGYRTPRSTVNVDTWKAANTYSARLLLIATVLFTLGQIALIKFIGGNKSLIYTSILLVLPPMIPVFSTSYHLTRET